MPAETCARADRVAAVDAKVVASRTLCREHVCIEVTLPAFPDSHPGQFLQLRCGAAPFESTTGVSWPADGFPSLKSQAAFGAPLLRRPFSIADRSLDDDGQSRLSVISRAVGPGTRWLEQMRVGDTLNLTGPLGRGFDIPAPKTPILLVGGGVGIPPLLYLARRLHETGHEAVTAVFGATCRDLLPLKLHAEPDRNGRAMPCVTLPGSAPFPAIITSDDGSIGLPGVATVGLQRCLEAAARRGARPAVMACGPNSMLRAVAGAAREHAVSAQLCIERNMGCGLGTCLSCIVRVHDETRATGWRWALTCTDGPVFPRDALFDYDDVSAPG